MSHVSQAQIADLLDAVADYVDDIEREKTAADTSAKNQRIDTLAERYNVSTGESLSDDLKAKLASLDTTTLDHLLKVAKNSNESPEALGKPADINDNPAPRTVKEAAAQADTRFLDWLVND